MARSPGAERKRATRRRIVWLRFGAPWTTPALDAGADPALRTGAAGGGPPRADTEVDAEGCGKSSAAASSLACHQPSSARTPHAVTDTATIDPSTQPVAMTRFFHHGRRCAPSAVSKTFMRPCV